jgi:hypothetical protein
VIPEDVAAELDVLASRVRRMSPRLRVTPGAGVEIPAESLGWSSSPHETLGHARNCAK